MKVQSINCSNCGSQLDLDLDHLQAFCPYCGKKLMIDVEQMSKLLEEKEKTKQIEAEEETKRIIAQEESKRSENFWKQVKDENRRQYLLAFGLVALFLFYLIISHFFW